MAQVVAASCNAAFVYAAQIPGMDPAGRLARYLKVPRRALKIRLRELNTKLPPMHVIIGHDMSTFDFSVQWNNHPARAVVYGNPAALAAELFPAVRVWLNRVQATQPAKRRKTVRRTPESTVSTPQCAEMHRNHMARCQDEAEKLIPELEVRFAFVLFFCATDSGTGCNFINLGRNIILIIIYKPGARYYNDYHS